MGILDQDPTRENIQNTIDEEVVTNFTTNILKLNTGTLIAFGKEQNFSIKNWEQLLFIMK